MSCWFLVTYLHIFFRTPHYRHVFPLTDSLSSPIILYIGFSNLDFPRIPYFPHFPDRSDSVFFCYHLLIALLWVYGRS